MVLRFLGREVSESDLADQLGTTALGTSGSRLLRLGLPPFQVFFGPLTLALVYQEIDRRVPVIALVRTAFLDYWKVDVAHAVVVVGYDERGLLLNDPAFPTAPQIASESGFLAAWGEFDFLSGVIELLPGETHGR